MAEYVWRNGGFHVKAQIVGERLAELSAENNNRLTPRMVVDDARPIDAALHKCFEWDDLKAAELFREDQARAVIRSVRVVTPTTAGETKAIRAYVNLAEQIGEDRQHAYISLATVLADDVLRAQMIVQARAELIAFKNRYSEFAELAAVADDALEQIDMLDATVTSAGLEEIAAQAS